ncbi:hypothetical protein VTN00DRAFT_2152 [Thermoascus crustaceus]|uniref:uncharacterized protein n=1 Tax=Thermoascus crustaceus TaxID=5088 RepID=UPI00374246B1
MPLLLFDGLEINKGLYEDLTEGKFSFPIIHSIQVDPQNPPLPNILKQRTEDVDVKSEAIRYRESTGSFEYTRRVLDGLMREARALAEVHAGTGRMDRVMMILKMLEI